ncbi:MAG: C4-dicarboxylate ABC transporter substrate-binding protein [Deltaproteobacteria bacterium]|nr:MAG: C4-dicarboxylate ABC transporter substrate-binding protein [Deltaproteobacteria bacterium]
MKRFVSLKAAKWCLGTLTGICLFFFLSPTNAVPKGVDKFLALGTSSIGGVYYPVGKAIAGLINAHRLDHGIRCIAYSTGGSVYNIQALASGELDLAITRSDLAYDAYNGKGIFKPFGPNKDLCLITTLYHMPVGIIVKEDSGISCFADFLGKRINIGNLGSGKRTIAEMLFKAMGWSVRDFSKVFELSTKKMGEAFCNGEIDILIQAMGIPATFYDMIMKKCNGKFLDIPAGVIHKIQQDNPLFEKTRIPGGLYPNNPQDVYPRSISMWSWLHQDVFITDRSIRWQRRFSKT